MSSTKELKEQLFFSSKNAWNSVNSKEQEKIDLFTKHYKTFLDSSKTEREFVFNALDLVKKNGFISLVDAYKSKQKLVAGDKVYISNSDKTLILATIGKDGVSKGINMVGSHIDSPRLDLKPQPFYEESDIAFLKTHYYGGIKKFQWLTIPLALHGYVMTGSGEKIDICIGEDENDPIFMIADILPHLAKDQYKLKIGEAVPAESLNVIIGSIPYDSKEQKDSVKLAVLKILNDKYGVIEKDFISAEIQVVPSNKARDIGLDRALIAAYGHDDRVCSYTGLMALLDAGVANKTTLCYLSDKEEVGSVGVTGAQSDFLEYVVSMIQNLTNENVKDIDVKETLFNSIMLSADVTAGYDPNFKSAFEANNSTYVGRGVALEKYTGSRGKSGASDASPELMNKMMRLLDANNVKWQTGELGKVDHGGGGTIAKFAAHLGINVLDIGVPLLSMHAPLEIASKIDIYMCYKAYKVFYKSI